MSEPIIHVAGPAGPVEQICGRCGTVLIDGIPAIEGRCYSFGPDGPERASPMFFTPGARIAVHGGGSWITDEEPTCAPTLDSRT